MADEQQDLFLTVLGAGSPIPRVSGETPPPGLQMTAGGETARGPNFTCICSSAHATLGSQQGDDRTKGWQHNLESPRPTPGDADQSSGPFLKMMGGVRGRWRSGQVTQGPNNCSLQGGGTQLCLFSWFLGDFLESTPGGV